MTTTTNERRYPAIDAAEWLLGHAEKVDRAVRRALNGSDGPQGSSPEPSTLRRVVRSTLGQEITAALKSALHADVGDMLISGWRKYRSLVDAGYETAAHPGTTKVLAVADHHVTASQDGAVDVILDGRRLLTVSGRLDLDFDIVEAVAVLRDGRLVAVQAGDVTIVGTATVQDQQVSQRTTTLPLHRTLSLGPGISLVPPASHAEHYPTPTSRPRPRA